MDLKILIASHEDFVFPSSKVFLPIHTGSASSKCSFSDYQRDDAGDNISSKNERYCELTALYWAWKNCKADYIGLMHYRRHLIFNNEKVFQEDKYGSVIFDKIDEKYYNDIGMTDNFVNTIVPDYDVILPHFWNTRKGGWKNTFLQYGLTDHHNIDDYVKTQRVLIKMYPEMSQYVKKYNEGSDALFCNMLVMRNDIFQDYCSWLFSILFSVERLIDYEIYSKQETRALAYIAERLLGIYTLYLMSKQNLRIHFLQRTRINNLPKRLKLNVPSCDRNVQIALSFDENYAPLASIAIKSILDNSNPRLQYDFYLFTKSITHETKSLITIDLEMHENKSLNFIDLSGEIESHDFFTYGHFTEETYYRFLLPKILHFLDKIIYLDCDILCLGDISELFSFNVSNYSLAGVRDAHVLGEFKCGFKQTYDYLKNAGMKNPYNYFQAGVLLLNLDKMRSTNFSDIALSKVSEKFQYVDQDIFNIVCEDDVLYLDYTWNVFFNHDGTRIMKYIQHAPLHIYRAYMKSRDNPKIIHFAGGKKPWQIPSMDFGFLFWNYARKSLWYETLLAQLSVYSIEQKILASQQNRNP